VPGSAILTALHARGTLGAWTTTRGSNRVEVLAIMGALADLNVNVETILGYFEGEDDDEAEEEDRDA
jgi:hypothetical protein